MDSYKTSNRPRRWTDAGRFRRVRRANWRVSLSDRGSQSSRCRPTSPIPFHSIQGKRDLCACPSHYHFVQRHLSNKFRPLGAPQSNFKWPSTLLQFRYNSGSWSQISAWRNFKIFLQNFTTQIRHWNIESQIRPEEGGSLMNSPSRWIETHPPTSGEYNERIIFFLKRGIFNEKMTNFKISLVESIPFACCWRDRLMRNSGRMCGLQRGLQFRTVLSWIFLFKKLEKILKMELKCQRRAAAIKSKNNSKDSTSNPADWTKEISGFSFCS